MPKLGMEPIRRKALIAATIDEIGQKGSLDITVAAIARRAGMSSGLAHHYFGGKDQIFLATMTHILTTYRRELLAALKSADTPRARVQAIVEASFSEANFQTATISSWLNFYALALSSPEANRVLGIYQSRLRSNLRHALRPLVADATKAAERLAAAIDGVYLNEALGETAPNVSRAVAQGLDHLELELKDTRT